MTSTTEPAEHHVRVGDIDLAYLSRERTPEAVRAEFERVARALIDAAEREALARGARSMTLHVFAANARARALYARTGYTEELIRCTKPLGS